MFISLFKKAEQVKHPSASVNPDSQALSKLTLLMLYIYSILVLYSSLKACKNNLNCNILALLLKLPLNILIILIKLSLSLTLNRWVLFFVLFTETDPNPNEFLI